MCSASFQVFAVRNQLIKGLNFLFWYVPFSVNLVASHHSSTQSIFDGQSKKHFNILFKKWCKSLLYIVI